MNVAMCVDSCGFAIAVRIVMDASKRSFARPGCNIDLSADFLNFGAGDLLECLFTNVSKLFVFSPWRRDPVLELKFLLQLLVVLWCFTDLFQSM
jgi:hypothetical protein